MTDRHAADAPHVFVSYSHDSEPHRARVLALANRLRADGVDAHIDRYVRGTPAEGWPTWMTNEIDRADFVLVVCTATYERRALKREAPGRGLGVAWEGGIVTQVVYDAQGRNTKFVPVVFGAADLSHIPVFLRGATYYDVEVDRGYGALVDYITGHHDAPMPPLGTRARNSGAPAGPAVSTPVAPVRVPGPAAESPPPRRGRPARPAGANAPAPSWAFGADRIEAAQALVLDLVALSPDGAERLQALRSRVGPSVYGSPPTVAVAYGAVPAVSATWARLREVGHEIAGGTTRWRLTLDPLEPAAGLMDDVTMNGYSPDDVAGWRARRILLDERPADRRPGDPLPGRLGGGLRFDPTLEMVLSGAVAASGRSDDRSLGPVEGSPLPALYAAWPADRPAFLAAARLTAALWLTLTRTVERVRRLDLEFAGDDRLAVRFEGVRRPLYTNREPTVVVVDGECPLRR